MSVIRYWHERNIGEWLIHVNNTYTDAAMILINLYKRQFETTGLDRAAHLPVACIGTKPLYCEFKHNRYQFNNFCRTSTMIRS